MCVFCVCVSMCFVCILFVCGGGMGRRRGFVFFFACGRGCLFVLMCLFMYMFLCGCIFCVYVFVCFLLFKFVEMCVFIPVYVRVFVEVYYS